MKILFVVLLCVALNVHAEHFEAKVLAVMDGDTVFVQSGPFKAKLRLANIDAPEKEQAYGKQSRESLQALIGGKVIQVESRAVDQFGRTIALVSVDGMSINEEQVKRGMAWSYSRSRAAKTYNGLQREAQVARRGLWQQPNPETPAQWRKAHPFEAKNKVHPHVNKPAPIQTEDASKFGALACGKKHYCKQMATCDEAHFYLTVCGLKRLDTNHDGVPCESLCIKMRALK